MSQVPLKLSSLEARLTFWGLASLLYAMSLDFAFEHLDHGAYVIVDIFTTLLFGFAALSRWLRDRLHYERLERCFDVYCTLPFALFIPEQPTTHILVVALQCIKLGKTGAIFHYFKTRRENMDLRRPQQIFLGLIVMGLIVHLMACFWIVLEGKHEATGISTYIRALYFIITTMATVGYGDIHPSTDSTRLFAMSVMVLGVTSFSLLIAQMSRLLLENDKRKATTRQKLDILESFLIHNEIPLDLQRSVYGFYNHLLSHQMNDLEKELMNELPIGLQTELQIYMNLKPLAKVSLFQGCERPCLVEASALLEHTYFSPGDLIIEKGQRGHEMFVIGHGSVRIVKENVVVGVLKDGDCFGELSLIYEGVRQVNIYANTYCDVFKLSGESFRQLLSKYPELQANVDRIILERKKNRSAS